MRFARDRGPVVERLLIALLANGHVLMEGFARYGKCVARTRNKSGLRLLRTNETQNWTLVPPTRSVSREVAHFSPGGTEANSPPGGSVLQACWHMYGNEGTYHEDAKESQYD